MKNRILISSIAIVLLITSCKKENNSSGNSNDNQKTSFKAATAISDFYSFWDQMKVAGKSYYIQSYSGIYDKPADDISSIAATIKGNKEPFSLVIDSKTLSFQDYDYNSDKGVSSAYLDENMTDFYGKNFDVDVSQNTLKLMSDGSITEPLARVHIPKLFYPVTFENLTQDGKVTAGTKIVWETDAMNENGVIIGIEYYPSTQSDTNNRINYPEYMLRGTVTDDNGEFTFNTNDFADFPGNADLGFYVVRAGFTTFVDRSSDTCTLAGVAIMGTGYTLSIP